MYDGHPLHIHIIKFIQQKPLFASMAPEQGTLFSERSQLDHIGPIRRMIRVSEEVEECYLSFKKKGGLDVSP